MTTSAGKPDNRRMTTPAAVARQRFLMMLTTLVFAWLLWSWMFKPLVLALGLVSCLLVLYIVHRMGYFRSELFGLRFNFRLLMYWMWLALAIFRSSLQVARVIIDPRLPISPRIVEIDTGIKNPVALTILANSITLTPGTLSLYVHDGIIKVQALTKEAADELVSGEMTRRVAAIWEE